MTKLTGVIIFLLCIMYSYAGFAQYQYPFTTRERDPFSPLISKGGRVLITQESVVSNFILKGIIYSDNHSLAIINDEVLKENDRIGNYIVLKIEEKRVVLINMETGKEQIVLKLEEE